jgi:hypothetical protein
MTSLVGPCWLSGVVSPVGTIDQTGETVHLNLGIHNVSGCLIWSHPDPLLGVLGVLGGSTCIRGPCTGVASPRAMINWAACRHVT